MSEMTWKDLRDLDCEALRTLGESWKSYTGSVSEQAQRLRDDVVKGHLSIENYESDTADTVREQVVMTADRFEDDLSDYALVRLSTGMFEAADALEAEQRELEELIPLIEDRGFAISGDPQSYTVVVSEGLRHDIENLSPPQWLMDRSGIDEAVMSSSTDHQNQVMMSVEDSREDRVVGQYVDLLREHWSSLGYAITYDKERTYDDGSVSRSIAAKRDDGITLWYSAVGHAALMIQSGRVPASDPADIEYVPPVGGIELGGEGDRLGDYFPDGIPTDPGGSEESADAIAPFGEGQAAFDLFGAEYRAREYEL